MTLTNNVEAQALLATSFSLVPTGLQQEYFALASAPIPKACFQVSQFIYFHRADFSDPLLEAGRDLLEYCTYVGQWNGLPNGLGAEQLNYLDKELGVESMQELDDVEAPDVHPQSGVTIPESVPEEEPEA